MSVCVYVDVGMCAVCVLCVCVCVFCVCECMFECFVCVFADACECMSVCV